MKRTINVNLGGQPFIIDEPAYDILHAYFEALKQKFTNENERKEILSDIEARVAEVFTERLGKSRAVVAEEDVTYVISLMGRPEDIAGEQEGASQPGQNDTTVPAAPVYTGPREKKFFRDPDNKKVGGVISGLCHYFGWGDPTWIRIGVLVAVVLSLFAGYGVPVPIAVIYLILLIVVPEATTGAEKLQMRGEPVTLQNIEKQVRDAMTTAGNSIQMEMNSGGRGARLMAILVAVVKGFVKFISVMLLLACACVMLVLLSVIFGFSALSGVTLSELMHLLVSSDTMMILSYTGAVLVIGVPLVSIMYDVIRFLANSKVRNPLLKRMLWMLWALGIIFLVVVGSFLFRSFNVAETTTNKVSLVAPRGSRLHVQLADAAGHILSSRHNGNDDFSTDHLLKFFLSKTENGYAFSDIRLEIAVSPDSNYYVERIYFSRGSSTTDALKNVDGIRYKLSQNDTLLNLDDNFEIPLHGKWRSQRVKIRIYMPEGKQISFADNVSQIETTVKDNDYFYDEVANRTMEVENGKLKCLDCKEKVIIEEDQGSEDEDDDQNTSININKNHIQISKNDTDDLKDISVKVNQSGVVVTGKNHKDENVKVKVTEDGVKIITTDSLGRTTIVKHNK